jgi:gamma-glutamyltranspeptidase/glutathione hydrolase
MKITWISFVWCLGVSTLLAQNVPYKSAKTAEGQRGMVVCPHPLASEAGVQILRAGGNAIDAAIAIQFAMAVVYPRAGNLGGGGFMLIRSAAGDYSALDYREKAPAAAHRDMYLDKQGNPLLALSQNGHLAAGVPGTPAGMVTAHQKYGTLPFKTLIQPAIELAEKGFPISAAEATRLNQVQTDLQQLNTAPNVFQKAAWKEGDLLVQKDLARALIRIKHRGYNGFYRGKTARLLHEEMKRGGGIICRQDLRAYSAAWRAPVSGYYKNYRVVSMPPPSSGGIALLQMLKMVENHPLGSYGFHSEKAVHLMAEASRRAFADRAEHLGDSDFYPVPLDTLLDSTYITRRMANFSVAAATPSNTIGAGKFQLTKEHFETEHTSVTDAEGNAVAVTTTLNSNYGSKVVVGGAGFFLNNEMDDFSIKPGIPNQFGLVGAEANAIQPGKRMLSSMTPTIVEKDGKLCLVLGAPGGSTIITAVFQVILNVLEFNLELPDAVKAGRFHHQWLPDQILVEDGALSIEVQKALEEKGHHFKEIRYMAVIKAIQRMADGRLIGAADIRNPDDDARAE